MYILGTLKVKNILGYWKDHQQDFPGLASVARDILSIPATGAGVERLFNSARDVCHYRRGSLNPTTIQELMMYNCTTKFEVESSDLALQGAYLSQQEIEAEQEEKQASQVQDKLDPISDTEEDDTTTSQEQQQPTTQPTSERVTSKRRRSAVVSDGEGERQESVQSDDERDHPLPETQQRVSGRNRKRARQGDSQFIEY